VKGGTREKEAEESVTREKGVMVAKLDRELGRGTGVGT